MWPKEIFELYKESKGRIDAKLKKLITSKSDYYFEDYTENREIALDKADESV
jgi:hypothetical protein